jgi:two-component system, chemotaxis family, chemotaxis protein CheY
VKIYKILVIDDSPIARIILRKCIPNNYEIKEADSGEKGLALLKDFNADLVFLDLTMPGISGFETLDRLKKINPELPVVVVSADRQQTSITKVLKLGAWSSLPKPPRREVITHIISEIEGKL